MHFERDPDQFLDGSTKAEVINCVVVVQILNYFACNIAWSSTVFIFLLVANPLSNVEIDDDRPPLIIIYYYENIVRLDIPVHDELVVQVYQSFDHIERNLSNLAN